MLAVDCKLLTGTSSGSLQLWVVDKKTTPPGVALSTSMEIDSGAVTSTNFNAKLELVRKNATENLEATRNTSIE